MIIGTNNSKSSIIHWNLNNETSPDIWKKILILTNGFFSYSINSKPFINWLYTPHSITGTQRNLSHTKGTYKQGMPKVFLEPVSWRKKPHIHCKLGETFNTFTGSFVQPTDPIYHNDHEQ